MDEEGIKILEQEYDLDDPELNIQAVFDYINKKGLTSKLKIPNSEKTDL